MGWHADCPYQGMHPIDFIPKLDNSTGRRSQPALNLWPLVMSAAGLFMLSWLLRRFAPTHRTMVVWIGLLVLAALLFFLAQQYNFFASPTKSRLQPQPVEAVRQSLAEIEIAPPPVIQRQLLTPLHGISKNDEAWAEAVTAYERAIQHLAAGRPGSRIEAQTSALELARLQGLLMQASQPHLPLGL